MARANSGTARVTDRVRVNPVYRGRFAPSPTGPLHRGSLVAALASWIRARQAGGQWLLRIEDIDPPRQRDGAILTQLQQLSALGLAPDERPIYQSNRTDAYSAALGNLLERGLAFECRCSRADLAPHDGVHRGACVSTDPSRPAAIRLRVTDQQVSFQDAVFGQISQNLAREVGDFVLRRADGLWAYQLAVVVDDQAQAITEVVRGADLLDSTPRQIFLQQLLGFATPAYVHLPVVLDSSGIKLSKSEGAGAVDVGRPFEALRAALEHLGLGAAELAPVTNIADLLKWALQDFSLESLSARSRKARLA